MDKLHEMPIDRVAARVIGKGYQYTPQCKGQPVDSDLPIQVMAITNVIHNRQGFTDLTGQRIGRLTVLGMSSQTPNRWVCRCDCGRYTQRTAKAIKNPENSQDRCSHCKHLAFLKREDERRSTGKHVDIRKF